MYFGALTEQLILSKSDKTYDFSFLVQKRLFSIELHGNFIICIVHVPPYQRCRKFENFLRIICRVMQIIFSSPLLIVIGNTLSCINKAHCTAHLTHLMEGADSFASHIWLRIRQKQPPRKGRRNHQVLVYAVMKPLKLLISSLIQGSAGSVALARSNGLITRQNGTLQEHLSDFEEFNRIWKKKNVKKGLSDCVKEQHLSSIPVKDDSTPLKYKRMVHLSSTSQTLENTIQIPVEYNPF